MLNSMKNKKYEDLENDIVHQKVKELECRISKLSYSELKLKKYEKSLYFKLVGTFENFKKVFSFLKPKKISILLVDAFKYYKMYGFIKTLRHIGTFLRKNIVHTEVVKEKTNNSEYIKCIYNVDSKLRFNLILDSTAVSKNINVIKFAIYFANKFNADLRLIIDHQFVNMNEYYDILKLSRDKNKVSLYSYSSIPEIKISTKKLDVSEKDIFISNSYVKVDFISNTTINKEFIYMLEENININNLNYANKINNQINDNAIYITNNLIQYNEIKNLYNINSNIIFLDSNHDTSALNDKLCECLTKKLRIE